MKPSRADGSPSAIAASQTHHSVGESSWSRTARRSDPISTTVFMAPSDQAEETSTQAVEVALKGVDFDTRSGVFLRQCQLHRRKRRPRFHHAVVEPVETPVVE